MITIIDRQDDEEMVRQNQLLSHIILLKSVVGIFWKNNYIEKSVIQYSSVTGPVINAKLWSKSASLILVLHYHSLKWNLP